MGESQFDLPPDQDPGSADPPSSRNNRGVPLWYLLAVIVPTFLVVAVPAGWAGTHLSQGLLPRPFASAAYLAGASQHVVELRGQTLALGWLFVVLTLVGALIGSVRFRSERAQGRQPALAGNRIAWTAVGLAFVMALVLTGMTNVIVFEPYPHGGVIGIGL